MSTKLSKLLLDEIRNNTRESDSLDLSHCHLDDNDAMALANALKGNTSLKFLDISDNEIGSKGAISFAKILNETSLGSLNLSGNGIDYLGLKALSDALKSNNCLKKLTFSNNPMDYQGVNVLAKALKENKSITHLSLEKNKISDEASVFLANIFKRNTTLTTLNLELNNIASKGYKAFSNILQSNNSLVALNLRGNRAISDSEIETFIESLKENTTCDSLTLLKQPSDITLNAVITSLEKNLKTNNSASLKALNLGPLDIGSKNIITLINALETNTTLTVLKLGRMKMDCKMLNVLTNLVSKNTTLKILHLKLAEVDLKLIDSAEILARLKRKDEIKLVEMVSTEEIFKPLVDALKQNTTLTDLKICHKPSYQPQINGFLARNILSELSKSLGTRVKDPNSPLPLLYLAAKTVATSTDQKLPLLDSENRQRLPNCLYVPLSGSRSKLRNIGV